jgi:chromosome segregation ATPase
MDDHMSSNKDIDSISKQIATLLVDIGSAQKEKTRLQIKLEELNLEAARVKEQYNMAEDRIRSAKHKITEFCVDTPLTVVK